MKDAPVDFLHDRLLPGTRANIDHIAVGASGVFVIDSKNVKGSVKVDWRGGLLSKRQWFLLIAGRDRTSWVEAVEMRVHAVSTALQSSGHGMVPVHGALCMANTEGLPWIGHPRMREIAICRPRHIAKRLIAAGPLDSRQIREVADLLRAAFPPA